MKILVTGGAGFIGSNLVDELIKQGNEVVVIDDLSSGKKEYLNSEIKFYKIDIRSDGVARIFKEEKPEYVFHLAAQIDVRISVKDPILDNKINVLGGYNILENCRRYKVKKIIFSSTGGAIYGDADEIPTTENYHPCPISPYGIHKFTFEKYLNYYYEVYGLPYTALRFSNVYGPRQFKGGEAGVVSIFIDNAINGRESTINGNGRQTRDFVFVSDIVNAFLTVKSADFTGVLNISDGVETNLLEIIDYIEKILGRKIAKKHVKAKTGEQLRSCLSFKKARTMLGWEPLVGFEEGIRKTIKWSKNRVINRGC